MARTGTDYIFPANPHDFNSRTIVSDLKEMSRAGRCANEQPELPTEIHGLWLTCWRKTSPRLAVVAAAFASAEEALKGAKGHRLATWAAPLPIQ